jgi:hypothetical protein
MKDHRTHVYVEIRAGKMRVLGMPRETYRDEDALANLLEALTAEQHELKLKRNREIREAHDTPEDQRTSDHRWCVAFTSRPDEADDQAVTPVRFYHSGQAKCPTCDRWMIGDARVIYCSNACKQQSLIDQRVPYRPRPKTEASCAHCGETFIQARSDAKFCSGPCRVAAHRKRR